MEAGCVSCHNTHPDSPKRDWKVEDVRGALEIIHPLGGVVAQTRGRLRETFALTAVMTVLGLSALALVVVRLRRTSIELEQVVHERTAELRRAKDVADGANMRPHREKLSLARATGDLVGVRAAAHALRGIAVNLGLVALGDVSRVLEETCLAGDADRVCALCVRVDASVEEGLARLRAFHAALSRTARPS